MSCTGKSHLWDELSKKNSGVKNFLLTSAVHYTVYSVMSESAAFGFFLSKYFTPLVQPRWSPAVFGSTKSWDQARLVNTNGKPICFRTSVCVFAGALRMYKDYFSFVFCFSFQYIFLLFILTNHVCVMYWCIFSSHDKILVNIRAVNVKAHEEKVRH